MKKCKITQKVQQMYLLFAAAAQALSLIIVICSVIFRKRKPNPLGVILSILALEGGTALLLLANMKKEIKELTMHGQMPAEEPAEAEAEEAEAEAEEAKETDAE